MSSSVKPASLFEGFNRSKQNFHKVIIHKGCQIIHRPENEKHPYEIQNYVGGIMGYICTGFETLEEAKKFAEKYPK